MSGTKFSEGFNHGCGHNVTELVAALADVWPNRCIMNIANAGYTVTARSELPGARRDFFENLKMVYY